MILRSTVLLATLTAVSVSVSVAAATSSHAAATLSATVGPGKSISLRGSGGAVRSLKAGTYTIVVRDRSKSLNFHLQGPTNDLSRSTTLKFVGKKTWRLKLVKAKYQYYSDRGGSTLKKSFRVV